ncbi:TrkH family potassium uptake protein [Fodinicurvata fenggangensis]|uniref:TrkH family potassium uptake protein n=1 Tax=Fodinicurvata fenggangensis TaxID=1121830 RepID=UPI00047D74A7|nr:TrkH family potassium uptake protein [Fodinicurvata fenggangensis]
MDFRPVGFILGFLILALAGAMAFPALLSLQVGDGEWFGFLASLGAAVFLAGILILSQRPGRIELSRRQAVLLTCLAWSVLPLIGSLPLLWSDLGLSPADAVFESVSGLTTTGSTVLSGLDGMAPSLLLWRSMLQWLGGIGIIAMGIAILPFLRVGGMQIFRLESSDRSDKVVPRANDFAKLLISVYLGLSLLCAIAYAAAGMSGFEAINHAMTTISTGGYSTSDASLGHFQQPLVQWLGTFFMMAGALPFVLYIQMLRGRPYLLYRDSQVRTLLAFLLGVTLLLAFWLVFIKGEGLLDALRLAAFNVTSVVTTTGYATDDYTLWGPFAVVAFYFLIFMGGCSGSTAGGFKIYRLQILVQLFTISEKRMITPNGIFFARFGGKPIDEEVMHSVASFMVLFVSTIAAIAMALGFMGLDFQTAFSGAATAVANVGPGIGPIIGPAGNFATLPDTAKWLLCLGMIMGRLEVLTLAILVMPEYWRP